MSLEINTMQLPLPEMEGTEAPAAVAWVGLCPECHRIVAGALIEPFESRGEAYREALCQILGEWQLAGMEVTRIHYRPTLDGCIKGCTWKPKKISEEWDAETILRREA